MKLAITCLMLLTANVAFANSPFDSFSGRYRILEITKGQSILQIGDELEIVSNAQQTELKSRNFIVVMREYSFADEGRFSHAKFITTPNGAKWWAASNGMNGPSVEIAQFAPGIFHLNVEPRTDPYDASDLGFLITPAEL